MKWVLIIVAYSYWGGGITKTEVGYYESKAECEEAAARLPSNGNLRNICAKTSKPPKDTRP